MRLFLGFLCVIIACGSLQGAAAAPEERYAEVRTQFEKGDFSRAQHLAESLLKDGHLSPELFQLMGHIRYRQGDLGRATLWYGRASLFPPPVPEVRQNIAHIHDRTGNLRYPANSVRDQFTARMSRTQWAHVAVTAGWVFVFAVALFYLHIRSFALRTLLMLVRVVALGIATVAACGWYWRPSYEDVGKIAVVTSPNAKAFTAATVTSGSVVALPQGSEIRKLEDRGTWCYVEIPTEGEFRRGWVQSEVLTPFWPFEKGYLE